MIAKEAGYDFKILESVIEVNENQYKIIIDKLKGHFGILEGKTIGMLGLAFKENTDDIRESVSIKIIRELLNNGVKVKAHDFKAINNLKKIFNNIDYAEDPYIVTKNADVVVITTEWLEYKKLDWKRIKDLMKDRLIIDGKNLLSPYEIRKFGFIYEGIGRRLNNG